MKTSLGAKTLLFPTPAMVIGTYDEAGRPNAMTAAWGGICCSGPPCLAVSVRPSRLTYANLMVKKEFTVSIPSDEHVDEVDYFGMAPGKSVDKFAKTGLTPARAEHVDAPYVEEFPLVLECKVRHVIDLGEHTQFIGEIIDVKVEERFVTDGKVDVEGMRSFWFAPGVSEYYGTGRKVGLGFSAGKRFLKR